MPRFVLQSTKDKSQCRVSRTQSTNPDYKTTMLAKDALNAPVVYKKKWPDDIIKAGREEEEQSRTALVKANRSRCFGQAPLTPLTVGRTVQGP